jgi:hypothetical protein
MVPARNHGRRNWPCNIKQPPFHVEHRRQQPAKAADERIASVPVPLRGHSAARPDGTAAGNSCRAGSAMKRPMLR